MIFIQLPEEIKIKQTLKRVRMKSKTTMKLVWDCAYYIPLLFSLKSFLSRPGVLEDVSFCQVSGLLSLILYVGISWAQTKRWFISRLL